MIASPVHYSAGIAARAMDLGPDWQDHALLPLLPASVEPWEVQRAKLRRPRWTLQECIAAAVNDAEAAHRAYAHETGALP